MSTSCEEIAKLSKKYFDEIVPKLNCVSFQPVSTDKVKDIIKTLNTKKGCPDSDVPVKLIKMNEDIFSRLIFKNFN